MFQSPAGFQMILKSGRVLERNPTTMEYDRVLYQHKDQQNDIGQCVHGISVPYVERQVSKIKI